MKNFPDFHMAGTRLTTSTWRRQGLRLCWILALLHVSLLSASTGHEAAPESQPAAVPMQGNLDLAFDLFDGKNTTIANLVGSMNKFAVPLRNGKFSITLKVQKEFLRGDSVWLQILASPGGQGEYIDLGRPFDMLTNLEGNRDSGRLLITGRIERSGQKMVLSSTKLRWSGERRKNNGNNKGITSTPATRVLVDTAKQAKPVALTAAKISVPENVSQALATIRETIGTQGQDLQTFLSSGNSHLEHRIQAFSAISLLNSLDGDPSESVRTTVLVRENKYRGFPTTTGTDLTFRFELQWPGKPVLLTIVLHNAAITDTQLLPDSGLQVLSLSIGSLELAYRPSRIEPGTTLDFDLRWKAGSVPVFDATPNASPDRTANLVSAHAKQHSH